MRTLNELLSGESALPMIKALITQAENHIEVLEGSTQAGSETLQRLQITTSSPMGAIAHHTGGLLLEDGWIRIIGHGHARLPQQLHTWTQQLDWPQPTPKLLVIAYDVLGGLFVLGGAALPGKPGDVFYFAPDTLEFEPLEVGYTGFLSWSMTKEGVADFYQDHRWPSWRDDTKSLAPNHIFSFYPFMFSQEFDPQTATRRAIPTQEAVNLLLNLSNAL